MSPQADPGFRRALRAAGVVLGVGLLFFIGRQVRESLGIEFSTQSVRDWVVSLGWSAPWIFLLLVAFRHFLVLPSAVILPVGGVLFGAGVGTLLGAGGVFATALIHFGIGRGIARGVFSPERLERLARRQARFERAGPAILCLVTAHPLGPMTPFHWGAGFSSLRFVSFVLAVATGALLRSFCLSFFGASLLDAGQDAGTGQIWWASAVVVGAVLLPFASPRLRKWLTHRSQAEGGEQSARQQGLGVE